MNIAAIPPTGGPVAVEPASAGSAAAGSAAAGSAQAGAAATAHITAAAVARSPQPVTPEAAQAQVVRAAAEVAVTRQGSLAPLLADVAQAVQSPGLPATVRTALQQVLALATPTDPPPTAADLKQAVAASGLFLESQLAAGTTPQTPDLKAALLVAQQVLKSWLADQPATAAEAGGPATATPPPYHDGPTTAQPPVPASLAAGADPASIGHRLLTETGAALARQQLLQIASLPGGHGGHAGAHPHPVPDSSRWQFEIPLQTAQGMAIAQFKVSRDGGGGGAAAAAEPVWRARFSIDLEPMGPIHAQVALSGAHAGVTLWAERPASADKLRAQAATLTQGLQSADFLPEVAVYAGAPPRFAAPAGQFVDQAS